MHATYSKALARNTKAVQEYLTLSCVLAALVIWFIGVLFPFYSIINSFFAAITGPFIGFAIPLLLFNWYYRTAERRRNCPVQPSK